MPDSTTHPTTTDSTAANLIALALRGPPVWSRIHTARTRRPRNARLAQARRKHQVLALALIRAGRADVEHELERWMTSTTPIAAILSHQSPKAIAVPVAATILMPAAVVNPLTAHLAGWSSRG